MKVHERVTAYLIIALLRHLGHDVSRGNVVSVSIWPNSVEVETSSEDVEGHRFIGGPEGDVVATDTRQHPIDWPRL